MKQGQDRSDSVYLLCIPVCTGKTKEKRRTILREFDGNLVHFIERHHIEGRPAEMIAENLEQAYNSFC